MKFLRSDYRLTIILLYIVVHNNQYILTSMINDIDGLDLVADKLTSEE